MTNSKVNAYRPDIDGLRAVAVISVLLYHLSNKWLPGGFVGVDIFFVISGFVVSASLATAPTDRLHRFVAFFYARRLARIMPALVLVLLCSALAATLFIPSAWLSGFSERTARFAFFGLSNWVMQSNADTYFAPRAEFNPYTHTWSLGVEEQFYVIFPLLFFTWVKFREQRLGRILATSLLAALGVASLIACVWQTQHAPATAFYSILCRFWELAVGVVLYQLTQHAAAAPLRWQRASLSVLPWLGAAAIAVTFAAANATQFPWFWALPPVLGAACIIGGFHADTAHPLRRLLAVAPWVWIGKRSYSIYLWHWPVFVLLRWTVGLEDTAVRLMAVLISLALASASYRWVELPIRHNTALLKRPLAVRIVAMLALVVVGWGGTQVLFSQQKNIGLSTVSRHAVDWYVNGQMPPGLLPKAAFPRRCEVATEYRSLAGGQVISYVPKNCTDGMAAKAQQLNVIGDSHAMAYLPMFDQLTAETGMRVNIYTFPSCAFFDLRFPMNIARGPDCATFTQTASKDITAAAKPGDILFFASLRQPRFADQWAAFEEKEALNMVYGELPTQWLKQAREEAPSLLQPFITAGMTPLIDAPKPVYRSPVFRCADGFNANNPVCRGGLTQSRDALLALRAPVMTNINAVAAQFPQVRVWDPLPTLCPAATCNAMDGTRPLFFDGDHLSAYGNAKLYPEFRDLIATLAK